MALPNFFIVGFPKCGTTALSKQLNEHPDIFIPEEKELRFFAKQPFGLTRYISFQNPNLFNRLNVKTHHERGIAWYEKKYDQGVHCSRRGDATPGYSHIEESAGLIAAIIPSAKIIFCVRNPKDLLQSLYWHVYLLGLDRNIYPSFQDMIETANPFYLSFEHITHFAKHIKRFLQFFPQENILIVFQEELRNHPKQVLTDVLKFLEVDPDPSMIDMNHKYNETPIVAKSRFLQRRLNHIMHFYLKWMKPHLPQSFHEKLREIQKDSFTFINGCKTRYPKIDSKLSAELLKNFDDDIKFLETFTGKDLNHWRIDQQPPV